MTKKQIKESTASQEQEELSFSFRKLSLASNQEKQKTCSSLAQEIIDEQKNESQISFSDLSNRLERISHMIHKKPKAIKTCATCLRNTIPKGYKYCLKCCLSKKKDTLLIA